MLLSGKCHTVGPLCFVYITMILLHEMAFILCVQNFVIHLDFGSVLKIVVRYRQAFLNLEILKSESLPRGESSSICDGKFILIENMPLPQQN